MSNDEKRDIEDRINDAMAKIVSDTAGEPQPENKNNRSAAHKSARPSKSARPRKITYVPIDESEFEPIVIPEKKKHLISRFFYNLFVPYSFRAISFIT